MFTSFKSPDRDFNSINNVQFKTLADWCRAIDNRTRHIELQLKVVIRQLDQDNQEFLSESQESVSHPEESKDLD